MSQHKQLIAFSVLPKLKILKFFKGEIKDILKKTLSNIISSILKKKQSYRKQTIMDKIKGLVVELNNTFYPA